MDTRAVVAVLNSEKRKQVPARSVCRYVEGYGSPFRRLRWLRRFGKTLVFGRGVSRRSSLDRNLPRKHRTILVCFVLKRETIVDAKWRVRFWRDTMPKETLAWRLLGTSLGLFVKLPRAIQKARATSAAYKKQVRRRPTLSQGTVHNAHTPCKPKRATHTKGVTIPNSTGRKAPAGQEKAKPKPSASSSFPPFARRPPPQSPPPPASPRCPLVSLSAAVHALAKFVESVGNESLQEKKV